MNPRVCAQLHNVSNWQKTAAANQKTQVKVFIMLWPTGSYATLNIPVLSANVHQIHCPSKVFYLQIM